MQRKLTRNVLDFDGIKRFLIECGDRVDLKLRNV